MCIVYVVCLSYASKKNAASYFQRCVEYVDVAGSLKFSSLPMWIVQKLQIHPEPQRPRCKNYELDFTKPKVIVFAFFCFVCFCLKFTIIFLFFLKSFVCFKMWQFFETVYDDYSHSLVENARSEEFRSVVIFALLA